MTRSGKSIFKIRKDFSKNILKCRYLKNKFATFKKLITIKGQAKRKDFHCIFQTCNKVFPNYTRWMLHYKMHVRIFLILT